MSSPERLLFLGVDGGGTKTAFALVDADGTVVAQAVAPSSYYLGRPISIVEEVLGEGVGKVCAEAGVAPDAITRAFLGLPGYGEVSADVPVLDEVPARVLGHHRYNCDNDMVAGWAGSLGGVDGVNVIAGTGSMTYGERAGTGARVGGWGDLFDDEGSAYWIAVRGLNLFAKMSDGRLPAGPLHARLSRHLELATDLDLVDVVLNRWCGDRARVASLAPVVADAADDGDAACTAVLAEAGERLAGLVRATVERLGFTADEQVPVSWSGGVFASEPVRAAFRAGLADVGGAGVDLREPLLGPSLGAALHAARLAGTPLDPAALGRLHRSTLTGPTLTRPGGI